MHDLLVGYTLYEYQPVNTDYISKYGIMYIKGIYNLT